MQRIRFIFFRADKSGASSTLRRWTGLARATGAIFSLSLALVLIGCGKAEQSTSPMDASSAPAMDVLTEMDASFGMDASFQQGDGAAEAGVDGGCDIPANFKWSSSGPIFGPVSDATHNLVAVKDPSTVYYNGKWHVFASIVAADGSYSIAYISFTDFDHTSSTVFYPLDQNPALIGYHAAPQIFYFRPQNKWYLVFQSGPPQYSTNSDIANPAGWTRPANFFSAEPAAVTQNKGTGGWLDFKVICDAANCYLFFSDDNGTFYRSQTTIADFPNAFGNTVVVMKDANAGHLFEGSNVYAMKGTGRYLALVEAFDAGSNYRRYYRSWTASTLDGTWSPLQDSFAAPFASTANITFAGTPWTMDISHGEVVRDDYDETMTIDTCRLQYLYQGFDPSAPNDAGYNGIPWRLGLLTKTN